MTTKTSVFIDTSVGSFAEYYSNCLNYIRSNERFEYLEANSTMLFILFKEIETSNRYRLNIEPQNTSMSLTLLDDYKFVSSELAKTVSYQTTKSLLETIYIHSKPEKKEVTISKDSKIYQVAKIIVTLFIVAVICAFGYIITHPRGYQESVHDAMSAKIDRISDGTVYVPK